MYLQGIPSTYSVPAKSTMDHIISCLPPGIEIVPSALNFMPSSFGCTTSPLINTNGFTYFLSGLIVASPFILTLRIYPYSFAGVCIADISRSFTSSVKVTVDDSASSLKYGFSKSYPSTNILIGPLKFSIIYVLAVFLLSECDMRPVDFIHEKS